MIVRRLLLLVLFLSVFYHAQASNDCHKLLGRYQKLKKVRKQKNICCPEWKLVSKANLIWKKQYWKNVFIYNKLSNHINEVIFKKKKNKLTIYLGKGNHVVGYKKEVDGIKKYWCMKDD